MLDALGGLEPVGVDASGLAGDAAGFDQPFVDAAVFGAEGAGEEVEFFLGVEFGADEILGTPGAWDVLVAEVFNEGVSVEPAAGVEVAKRELPDMVLMDVVMPNLNGFQATRTLNRDASTRHIPVILVTTKDQDTDRMWGLRQGAKAYLTKPFSEDELAEVIERIFNTIEAPAVPPAA